MPRKPKQGIDYAGWNTDIFENDTKIDRLIDDQGWIGFCVYFYLCQKAYASDGYFYRWTYADAPTTARRMGGGIRSGTVISAVGTCLRTGLFEKRLLDELGILTSKGIQRRFIAAIEKRSFRAVDHRFWLLDEPETAAGKITFLSDETPGVGGSKPINDYFLPENADFLPENVPLKVKESKDITISGDIVRRTDVQRVIEAWNSLGLAKITKIVPDTQRGKWLSKRLHDYGIDDVLKAIDNIRTSGFLKGDNRNGWTVTFDWFIRPNNFPKVLDGNYNDGGKNDGEQEYF